MSARPSRTAWLVAAALAGSPVIACAQSVSVVLSLDKPSFFPGEPFAVHVTVTASSSTSIPASLDARHGFVQFYVSAPDATGERLFRPWALFENPTTRRLMPGEPRTESSRIFFGADGWTFPSPGRYRVRATLGERSSEPVAVDIVPPTVPLECEQSAALLANREAGMFLLLDGGDHLENGIPELRRIAASRTRLAGYAAHSLGTSRAVRFSNLRTGQVREPNAAEARPLLERARVLLPPDAWHFRALSVGRLDAVLRLQGRNDLATQLQQDFAAQIQRANLAAAVRDQILQTAIIRR